MHAGRTRMHFYQHCVRGFVKDETAKNVLFGALPVDTVTYTELPGGR